jgi:hypothetical protein
VLNLVHWYHSVPVKRGRNRVPLIPFVATWLSSSILNNLVPSFACCVYCSSCGFIGWPAELLLPLLLIVITPWYIGTDRYQWSEDGHYTLLHIYGTDGVLAPLSFLVLSLACAISIVLQCATFVDAYYVTKFCYTFWWFSLADCSKYWFGKMKMIKDRIVLFDKLRG